jgi:ABC-type bacteriocin/lantibiotic exporter with double-glycine peptidase domain
MINYLNEYTIILIIIILIILSQYDLKYILLILIILYILYIYSKNTIIKDIIKKTNNNDNTDYNNIISELFDDLDKFKNLNLIEYKYGLNYWNRFINNIKNVNTDDQSNFYDKTETYLDTSIKHFRSLTLISNDKNLIYTINNLHKEGLLLLKKLAINFNNSWKENPDILKKEIIFNQPKPHNISFI